MQTYTVQRVEEPVALDRPWNSAVWAHADTAEVAHVRPESTDHHPETRLRLLYDAERLYGLFQVHDRYVRSRHTRFLDPVYTDSCVEIFLQPRPGRGYLNFEFNAGGAFLISHITDPARVPGGFREYRKVAPADGATVRTRASLPAVVEPERVGPCVWTLAFSIPFALLTAYAGATPPAPGAEWRVNFYKCGDETSHPHWISWSPVDELNFHLPRCFGALRFGD